MIHLQRAILPNGLRIVHSMDATTPMVCMNVLYNVGSKDEQEQLTGFAHLFEHLMFGGSAHIPDYDTPLQEASGENNAWTNTDLTNYYLVLPKENIERGFWLESDRMLELAFSERSLDTQKSVVIEEFKERCLNQPYGDIGHIYRPLCYQHHPYRWPVIGKEISHIQEATLDQVKEFFYSHYAPNNAILAVCGNISFEQTVSLAQKWMSDIPSRVIAPRLWNSEPIQTAARLLEIERNVPTDTIYKYYHTTDRLSADYNAVDMITDILDNGRSARLYQRLVKEQGLFHQISCSQSGDIESGLIHISGKLASGVSFDRADRAIEEQLQQLTQEPVQECELDKLKSKFEATHIYSNLDYSSKAFNLAYYELLGNAEWINQEVALYQQTTAEHLRAVAERILAPSNCNTIYYKATK